MARVSTPAAAPVGTLPERLAAAAPELTAQERRVAEAMLADAELIYRAITEFATAHRLGYGSVVRTCQKLGYAGFHDLKLRRARELAPETGPQVSAGFAAEAAEAIAEIQAAAAALDEGSVEAAASCLAQARQILAIGCAGSAPVADELVYRLLRLGLPATAAADSHLQAIRAACLGPEDVLIAVSASGATKEVLHAVAVARARGATVLALTEASGCALARVATILLRTGVRRDVLRAEIASKVATAFCLDLLCRRIAPLVPDAGALHRTAGAVAGNLL